MLYGAHMYVQMYTTLHGLQYTSLPLSHAPATKRGGPLKLEPTFFWADPPVEGAFLSGKLYDTIKAKTTETGRPIKAIEAHA